MHYQTVECDCPPGRYESRLLPRSHFFLSFSLPARQLSECPISLIVRSKPEGEALTRRLVYGLNQEGSCGWQTKEILESFSMTSCIRNQMVQHGIIIPFLGYHLPLQVPLRWQVRTIRSTITTQSPSKALTIPYDVLVDGSSRKSFRIWAWGGTTFPMLKGLPHHSFYPQNHALRWCEVNEQRLYFGDVATVRVMLGQISLCFFSLSLF